MSTILISGGSDGLGKATAIQLAKKHTVVILAKNPEKTKKAAEEIGCDFVVADVVNYAEVERAVNEILEKHTSIDCLINNAGLWLVGLLESNDPTVIKQIMDVNALGPILLTRAVLPHMKQTKRGRIINIISQAGFYPKAERAPYYASKWAVTGFTKSLALELAGSGVAITGFYPGAMQTNMFATSGDARDTSQYLNLSEVVRALEFVIETPVEINIPEFGITPA